jgi:glycine cleavage system H protein
MSIPSDRKYAKTHEWIKAEGDVMIVGITGPAQEQLGDLALITSQVHAESDPEEFDPW